MSGRNHAIKVSNGDSVNLKALDRKFETATNEETKYWQQNDAKFRAVAQKVPTYEHFREMVAASHLRPLDPKEKIDFVSGVKTTPVWDEKRRRAPWNNAAGEAAWNDAPGTTGSSTTPAPLSTLPLHSPASDAQFRRRFAALAAAAKAETAAGLQQRQETAAGLQQRQETAAGFQQRQETAAGLQQRQETAAGLQQRQETAARLQQCQETAAGFQQRQETAAGLQQRQETAAGLQQRKETAAGLQQRQETAAGLKQRPETANARRLLHFLAATGEERLKRFWEVEVEEMGEVVSAMERVREEEEEEEVRGEWDGDMKRSPYDSISSSSIPICNSVSISLIDSISLVLHSMKSSKRFSLSVEFLAADEKAALKKLERFVGENEK